MCSVFCLELQCRWDPDHINHHKLLTTMLQVIFIHTLFLAVDPAVPCKLALILQRGLGAPGEHRVRRKDETTRLHKVRRAQPAADPPCCPASREARKARTGLSTFQLQRSRRSSTGERRCAPRQSAAWGPVVGPLPSLRAPPTTRNPPQGGGAGAEAPPLPRPASNKPERQHTALRWRLAARLAEVRSPRLRRAGAALPHCASARSCEAHLWEARRAQPRTSRGSSRAAARLSAPAGPAPSLSLRDYSRSDLSSTTVSAPSSPRAPPAWAARPLGPIFCGSTAPVSLFCELRALRPSSQEELREVNNNENKFLHFRGQSKLVKQQRQPQKKPPCAESTVHIPTKVRVGGVDPRFLRDGCVPGVGKEALRPRPAPSCCLTGNIEWHSGVSENHWGHGPRPLQVELNVCPKGQWMVSSKQIFVLSGQIPKLGDPASPSFCPPAQPLATTLEPRLAQNADCSEGQAASEECLKPWWAKGALLLPSMAPCLSSSPGPSLWDPLEHWKQRCKLGLGRRL
ncbi:PREDICTED: uncharacterized protein LOC103069807 [Lipotes vexillifer]|uniref:Uncharacterized protein LOC103069807 n=1 Tax=Lipotes vexillifer TaxID=118797 RepID=A0A340YC10_LIPVE|nr:PREDICTED: uncharacterized protein LOC103069807 [Lipotes vexillifer]